MAEHKSERIQTIAEWCIRLSLGLTLLSAVADRFGLWGLNGVHNFTWGDWSHFVRYCGVISSFLPRTWTEPLARAATALETVCGIGLISGIFFAKDFNHPAWVRQLHGLSPHSHTSGEVV